MKTILSLCVIALLALPAAAVDRSHVRYFGGTAPGVKAGVVGRIDTTSETSNSLLAADQSDRFCFESGIVDVAFCCSNNHLYGHVL